MDGNQIYKDNYKLITWKVKRYSDNNFDELLSEANLIFTKCLKSYKSVNGSFSAYLSKALDRHLSKIIPFYSLEYNDLLFGSCDLNIDSLNYSFWKKSLCVKSQEIIDFIFSNTSMLKITKQKLYKYFKSIGWRHKDIVYCFNEIQLALENI